MMEINKIYNEDCLIGMQRIPDKSIDMILCDLPYGTSACKWDVVIPFEPLWEQYKRIIKDNGAIVLFGSQPFTSALVMSSPELFRYEIIWIKHQATNPMFAKKGFLKAHENILVFYDKLPTYNPIIEYDKPYGGFKTRLGKKVGEVYGACLDSQHRENPNGERCPVSFVYFSNTNIKKQHPTQKPVPLMEYLIKTYTNEGELVLDNCIGSGTTAIACINTNRNYIGFELDKGYFEIAQNRIINHSSEKRLF